MILWNLVPVQQTVTSAVVETSAGHQLVSRGCFSRRWTHTDSFSRPCPPLAVPSVFTPDVPNADCCTSALLSTVYMSLHSNIHNPSEEDIFHIKGPSFKKGSNICQHTVIKGCPCQNEELHYSQSTKTQKNSTAVYFLLRLLGKGKFWFV